MSASTPGGTTSRRTLLQAAGAGFVASMTAPILHATDKAGTKPPILGKGRHQYEALHDWGKLPKKLKWGDTHGVCFDEKGRVYIIHTVHPTSESPDGVAVLDPDGTFITSWGKEFRGGGHGIEIHKPIFPR